MPDPLVSYWNAWNEQDLERVPQHLARAVTGDVEWNDPRDTFVGIGSLETAIRRLRTSKPGYHFYIASEIDSHHGRLRYRWDMLHRGRTLMEGLDIVTLEPSAGLICRVDGFFGHPTPINHDKSGVPDRLRHEIDDRMSQPALCSEDGSGRLRAGEEPGQPEGRHDGKGEDDEELELGGHADPP